VHRRLKLEGPPAHAALLLAEAPIEVWLEAWPEELAGLLVVRSGGATIGLNGRHPAARRHFTFWHEVGHYVLHATGRRLPRSWQGGPCSGEPGSEVEREADAFAACVLMPQAWLSQSLPEAGGATALARRFMVSRTAMERRLRELGLD
jgi:Zn-dependent peptidase ImmA (M78 family)